MQTHYRMLVDDEKTAISKEKVVTVDVKNQASAIALVGAKVLITEMNDQLPAIVFPHIINLIAGYLTLSGRNTWEADLQAAFPVREGEHTYRNLWAAEVYSKIVWRIGAGLSTLEYKVNPTPAKVAIDLLNQMRLLDLSETEAEAKMDLDEKMANRGGIRFTNDVNERRFLVDCTYNYTRTVLIAPLVTQFSALILGYLNCVKVLHCFSYDYSQYTAAPNTVCFPNRERAAAHRNAAQMHGCVDNDYHLNSCAYKNIKFIGNEYLTYGINTFCFPLANHTVAAVFGLIGYSAGAIKDCVSSEPAYKLIPDKSRTVVTDDIILIRRKYQPTANTLGLLHVKNAYVRYQKKFYFLDKDGQHALTVKLDLKDFDRELQLDSGVDVPVMLSPLQLEFITANTTHEILTPFEQYTVERNKPESAAMQRDEKEKQYFQAKQTAQNGSSEPLAPQTNLDEKTTHLDLIAIATAKHSAPSVVAEVPNLRPSVAALTSARINLDDKTENLPLVEDPYTLIMESDDKIANESNRVPNNSTSAFSTNRSPLLVEDVEAPSSFATNNTRWKMGLFNNSSNVPEFKKPASPLSMSRL